MDPRFFASWEIANSYEVKNLREDAHARVMNHVAEAAVSGARAIASETLFYIMTLEKEFLCYTDYRNIDFYVCTKRRIRRQPAMELNYEQKKKCFS